MTRHQQNAARPLRRRSLLGLLGAAPLAAGVPLAARAMAATGTSDAGSSAGQGQCGPPPADLLPGGAYDQHLTAMAAQDQFSGTVLLAYDGRPVLSRAFGWADKERGIPNQTGTLFNLQSVTKVFTGVAVAQLAAQGKIDFYATLGSYLDNFPAEVAAVTVHQMLTHTAGMGDYTQTPAFASEWQTWDSAAAVFNGIMAIIRTMPLVFTPGTQYQYSNTGFFVLGAIVAQVSGQSYYDYMRQHVFSPAGMARTDFYTQPQMLASSDFAHPYVMQNGQYIDVASQATFIGGPDHGAYSSGPELLAFAGALQSGRLLTPAYTELALSGKYPVAQATGEPASQSISIGYGVENLIINNERVFGHPGGAEGANTDLNIYPGVSWVAAVLGNYAFDVASLLQLQNQLITQQASRCQ